jgi:hypothetical protein
MSENIDEQIQNEILGVLFHAYRNPKGKYRNVTFPVLLRDVRDKVTCEREDVLREVRYLIEKKMVKTKKERYSGYKIGNSKMPGGYTEYYFLSGDAIDILQSPGKYSNIGYMLSRHTVKILKKDSGFTLAQEYRGDFQPNTCFLPIEASVVEEDKIQLIGTNGQVLDEKIVGKVEKYYDDGPLAHIEVKWQDNTSSRGSTTVNISGSPILAPVTIGSGNYVVSYNSSADTNKIIQMVREKSLDEDTKNKVISLIQEELPKLLEKPEVSVTKPLLEKIKALGQTWLIPIVTQMAATYFQHQLGINQ